MIPCRHTPGTVPTCRYCKLWNSSPRVRAAWGGPEQKRRGRVNQGPEPARIPAPYGPGDALRELLAGLGLHAHGCRCEDRARQMNAWGVRLCRVNMDEIVEWLKEVAAERGWLEKAAAGARAVVQGIPVDVMDPYRGLVEEALRRFEERQC